MDSSVYLCRCDRWNVTQSECFRPFPRLLAVFPFLHCYVDSIWLNLTQLHGRSAFFRTFEADCLWCWYLCSQPSSSPSSFCSRILETGEFGKVFISWHLIGRYVETVGVPIKFGLWASQLGILAKVRVAGMKALHIRGHHGFFADCQVLPHQIQVQSPFQHQNLFVISSVSCSNSAPLVKWTAAKMD